ncbi:MAG: TraG/TraD/VirD4 family protein, partial [Planctomycetota bacterium]
AVMEVGLKGSGILDYRDHAVSEAVVPTLVAIDEFPQLGKMDEMLKAMATLGGAGYRFLLGVQSKSQLIEVYGQREPVTAACPIWVVTATQDPALLEDVKKLAAKVTVEHSRTSHGSGGRGDSHNLSQERTGRDLLDVHDLRTLPSDEAVMLAAGVPPVTLKKRPAFREKRWRERIVSPRVRSGSRGLGRIQRRFPRWGSRWPARSDLDVATVALVAEDGGCRGGEG